MASRNLALRRIKLWLSGLKLQLDKCSESIKEMGKGKRGECEEDVGISWKADKRRRDMRKDLRDPTTIFPLVSSAFTRSNLCQISAEAVPWLEVLSQPRPIAVDRTL